MKFFSMHTLRNAIPVNETGRTYRRFNVQTIPRPLNDSPTPTSLIRSGTVIRVLDISGSKYYALAARDALPIRTIRLGSEYRHSRRELEDLVGADLSQFTDD